MPHTILLVDDNDDTREFMRIWLEDLHFYVVEATDGREAVECTKQTHPDLILMDIGMPIMDGVTATMHIRELEEGRSVPVVAVTAHSSWYCEEALKAGCNRVISKPIDPDSLNKVITHYLSN
jgi:CheY-like chemotaxis protein